MLLAYRIIIIIILKILQAIKVGAQNVENFYKTEYIMHSKEKMFITMKLRK